MPTTKHCQDATHDIGIDYHGNIKVKPKKKFVAEVALGREDDLIYRNTEMF